MNTSLVDGYRSVRRGAIALALGAAVTLGGVLGALAADGTFEEGGQVKSDGYEEYEYAAAPYEVEYDGNAYTYGTGKDGKGSYVTYDGCRVERLLHLGRPAGQVPVAADGSDLRWVAVRRLQRRRQQVLPELLRRRRVGRLGRHLRRVQVRVRPVRQRLRRQLYVYGTATDGYVYYKQYDGSEWTSWEHGQRRIRRPKATSLRGEWDGYKNVFWTARTARSTGTATTATEWTGAKALPGDCEFRYAPYAVEYDGESLRLRPEQGRQAGLEQLRRRGLDGWPSPTKVPTAKVKYQPNAYVYEDEQHVVYTGDDGHAYYAAYDGQWSDWQDLGDNYAYDPYPYEYGDELLPDLHRRERLRLLQGVQGRRAGRRKRAATSR